MTAEQWIGLGVMLLGGLIFLPGLCERVVIWRIERDVEGEAATGATPTLGRMFAERAESDEFFAIVREGWQP